MCCQCMIAFVTEGKLEVEVTGWIVTFYTKSFDDAVFYIVIYS